jgi:tetratricopeptide (TPR) repeat protein
LEEAYASIKAAIKENPQYVEAYNNLGVLYRDECEIEEAIACYDKCLAMQPLSRNAGQNRLLAMNCNLPLLLITHLFISSTRHFRNVKTSYSSSCTALV